MFYSNFISDWIISSSPVSIALGAHSSVVRTTAVDNSWITLICHGLCRSGATDSGAQAQ